MKHKKKSALAFLAVAAALWWLWPDNYPAYPESDHYDPKSRTFFNPEPQAAPTDLVSAMWQMLVNEQAQRPPKPLPAVKPDWPAFLAAPEGKSRFVWFGHSTLLMRIGGQTVITDPYSAAPSRPCPS